jgi:DNA polymerase-4
VLGSWGGEIVLLARGEDDRPVIPDRDAKSIGAEATYDQDLTDKDSIARSLLAHAQRVAERLTEEGLAAGGVTAKLKYSDFTILTRQKTLEEPASDTRTLHDACIELLDRFPLERARVRLTGVSAHDLGPAAGKQPLLFPDRAAARRRELEGVLLSAKDRFGGHPITFATLLEDEAPKADPAAMTRSRSWARGRRRD